MKRIIFLITILTVFALNVLGQSPVVKTNPAMDSTNVVNIQMDKNDGVIASIENSVSGETYTLTQLGIADGKIEAVKGNGVTIEFSKLNFTSEETKYYMIQNEDSKVVGSIKVNSKASLEEAH